MARRAAPPDLAVPVLAAGPPEATTGVVLGGVPLGVGPAVGPPLAAPIEVSVRRILRRDLNRTWEFLKLVFRGVNKQTVEYQRPRSKARFLEVYEEDGIEQLLFEVSAPGGDVIVGYAECAYEISGSDNWMNERYFNNREMRPLFVEELAVHPGYQGQGVGRFVLEQIDHLARLRGCTHLVLEVAENNENALRFYRGRHFYKLDAAIFMAKKVDVAPDLLPPRQLANRAAAPKAPGKAAAKPGGTTKAGRAKGAGGGKAPVVTESGDVDAPVMAKRAGKTPRQ